MDQDNTVANKIEDIASEYANNTFLEPSVWDLKLFFGQWYQSNNGEIDWHSGVTLPWMQAKLLAHYLAVNVALYETLHGKIHIPSDLRPKVSSGLPPSEANPMLIKSSEFVDELTRDFLNKLE